MLPCPSCHAFNRVPLDRLGQSPKCGKCKSALPTDPVLSVDAAGLEAAVRSCPIPVVVDFWAPWCGPCKSFAPVFSEHARKAPAGAVYLKLNTEEHPQAANRYGIRGIPTLIAFRGAKELARQSGAMNPGQLQSWLTGNIPSI